MVVIGLLVAPRLSGRTADSSTIVAPPDPPAAPFPANGPGLLTGAAATPAAYTVEAALYRVAANSSRRERLDSGAQLALGDRLTLEMKASTPLHVYVINEDEAGHSYALFPLPGLQLQNPLPPGATHRLPGARDGSDLSWTVDSPGGREHLMVVASPTRLIEFEAEMNSLAKPGQMAVPIPERAKVRLRGIGGLEQAPSPVTGESAQRLFDMAERLASRSETVTGVWMRRIDLENPR
ncbi:MAG TPA: DUF4384 domain-containing protein [Patescibacteria group bacterium]|nr:DUF4384 domain-containing protein [Patescibacteria group bacterium]